MSIVWNRGFMQSRPSRCWPHLFAQTLPSTPLIAAGLFYDGLNNPEIVPAGLAQFLWSAASYSVNITASVGAKSLTINRTKSVGTRDLGFADEESTLGVGAVLGEGAAVSSIKQRLEVLSRSYPSDYDDPDEFYVGSAGVRRIDSCTAFYESENLTDPEAEDPEATVFRNELCVIMHHDLHYPTTPAVNRDGVDWYPTLNKWVATLGAIEVRARMRETFDGDTYDIWSNILGPGDTSTTLSAFGGDLILGHDPEVTVSGNMSVAAHLTMF